MKNVNRRALDAAIASSIADRQKVAPGANAFGTYYEILNGELVGTHSVDIDVSPNNLPTEGILDCLETWLSGRAKKSGWFLGLYANAVAPAAGWTAANVAATAGEITSTTQGYVETTRQQFVPNAATGGAIDNVGEEATFTIIGAGDISVEGAFLISDSSRGGTSGVLASATRYASTRKLQAGDIYKVGYRITLTSG